MEQEIHKLQVYKSFKEKEQTPQTPCSQSNYI